MKRSRIQPRRRTKHQVANEPHREYIAWLHEQACAACGTRQNIQAAHVGQGGTSLKHGSDAEAIPLCGPNHALYYGGGKIMVGCHFDHDNRRGQFRLMTKPQRRMWDADQIAIHRARFESRNERLRVIPF